ncbi:hypothetical protein RirG_132260 [Rhizophagus irregularis DAOM 197198w]|nr:hypothetical protein RirG_132260 [Rhizophagus irregularis DAOM 197198w]
MDNNDNAKTNCIEKSKEFVEKKIMVYESFIPKSKKIVKASRYISNIIRNKKEIYDNYQF